MEQLVLQHFDNHRHAANSEVITGISDEILLQTWTAQVQAVRHRRRRSQKPFNALDPSKTFSVARERGKNSPIR